MLAGAAVLDVRTRRIPNAYWFPFLAASAALLAVEAGLRGLPALGLPLAFAAAVAALAYLAWRLRLFGGADAKALMVLAALVPDLPAAPSLPFALDTLMNGSLAALAFPLGLLAWNALRGDLRLPAALLGHRMPIARARAAHVWPMQWLDGDRLRWRYGRLIGLDTDAVYDRLAAAGHDRVWVTAKLPFAALLALGAAAAAVVGNVPLRVAQALAGPG
jgi:Flp pilus assembly protein protease CpaA